MIVVVRGLGNIGTTLVELLLRHRQRLGIDEVRALKGRPNPWDQPELDRLRARGAAVYVADPASGPRAEPALAGADFVFDCRTAGGPLRDLPAYQAMGDGVSPRVVAQGSETGFGVPFVAGVNDHVIHGQRFVQVGSCNTHALAALLCAIAGPGLDTPGGADLAADFVADFVIVRRSEDLGSHDRLVAASVVSRHRDPAAGTHHAIDVARVFATLGRTLVATSSDVTTPSQLMHAVRFSLPVGAQIDAQDIVQRIEAYPWLATTSRFDSNAIFELGRRHGVHGRIYSHAIVVTNNLLVTDHGHGRDHRRVVRGWAFVPQEGNTLPSTLVAFLRQTRHPRADDIAAELRADLLAPRW